MVAVAALATWIAGMVVGVAMLLRWRRPPATAFVHLATAGLGLVAWVGYLVADRPDWLAWAVFGWLIVINSLGDLLLVGGWRSRTPVPRPRGVRAYVASARDLLSGRRPVAMLHGLLAPATFGLVFLVAVGF